MSEFVNYHKREVSLPYGCKNLADVLKTDSPGGSQIFPQNTVNVVGTLADLGKYVAMVYEASPEAECILLSIQSVDKDFNISVGKGTHLPMHVSIRLPEDMTEQDAALRGLFLCHGFPLPSAISGKMFFDPNLPIYTLYQIIPCPQEPAQLVVILNEVLQTVFRVTEETPLNFCLDI